MILSREIEEIVKRQITEKNLTSLSSFFLIFFYFDLILK